MKRGPVIYGVLLLASLGFAYQTWTRDTTVNVSRDDVVVWPGAVQDINVIAYESELRSVRIERRKEGDSSYLWAKSTRTIPARKPPPRPGDAGPTETLPEPKPTITLTEFPIGDAGEALTEALAPLKAMRDLGVLDSDQKKEYGLDNSKKHITVTFSSGEEKLAIGNNVYGGQDRYGLDSASGRGYVLAGAALRPLDSDGGLRLKKMHTFAAQDVTKVAMKTPAQTQVLVHSVSDDPNVPPTWANEKTPDVPDQTFANWMNRINNLRAVSYHPEQTTDGLVQVVRLDFSGKSGQLGYFELYKKPTGQDGLDLYYVMTERTRVLGEAQTRVAKSVETDLAQLFAPTP